MKLLIKLTLILALLVSPVDAEEIYPELLINDGTVTGVSGIGWGADVAFDGNLAAVAAPDYKVGNETRGAVYIYRREGPPLNLNWVFKQLIVGPLSPRSFINNSITTRSYFANSIALKDGFLVVGQRYYGTFPLVENLWSLIDFYQWNEATEQFVDAGGQVNSGNGNQMGTSIAISGDRMVVGGYAARGVYCYERNMNGSFVARETIPKVGAASGFGTPILSGTQTVALEGDWLAVGAPRTASNRGAVYIYRYENGSYIYQHSVTPDNQGVNYFGDSVVIRGDTMVVTAPSNGRGALYVYNRTPGGWTFSDKLIHGSASSTFRHGMAGVSLTDDAKTLFCTSNAGYIVSFKLAEDGTWKDGPAISPDNGAATPGFSTGIALDGGMLLGTSVVGPSFTAFLHDDSNATFIAGQLRAQLYHEDAVANPLWEVGNAAFRYRQHIYEKNAEGEVERASSPTSEFGTDEQGRVDRVLALISERLQKDPFGTPYHDLFLDIIYDLTSIKMLRAQDALTGLDLTRIGPPPVGGQVIDNEIALYEASLPMLRDAIGTMLESLDADIAYTASGAPAGYEFFKSRVPLRPLMPATYLDAGTVTPLSDLTGTPITDSLVDGYRDALLFFQMLGEYGASAAELAKLYRLSDRRADAQSLLQNARELVFLQGSVIRGIFRDPATGADPAQLEQALASWEQGISDLKSSEDAFDTGLNPLGFDDDFLVLLQRDDSESSDIFNTFDILEDRVINDNRSFLSDALDDQQAAIDDYATYRSGLDELQIGLININDGAELRLAQIVGRETTHPLYDQVPGPNVGAYGGFIQGSEMANQFLNIRRARLQILRNGQEMANIEEKVRIEVERNLFEVATQNAIADIRIDYAGQRADMETEISQLNAAQKYTEVLADAANPANWAQVGLNAINGGVQVYGELRKGELAAERERMAAQEEAAVIGANNEILNANSAALIATWMLDMKTLALSSQENAVILQQEMGRLVGLMRERKTLERRIQAHTDTLKERYFADPVHRLRFLNSYLIAQRSFETAQQTVFLMARALEYKWNTPFDEFMTGTGTELNDIFSARNAQELDQIVTAMGRANDTNISSQDYEDVFSIKEDALGYVEGSQYPHPVTGVMVSATEAFQARLEADFLEGDFNQPGSYVTITIPFSTVRDPLLSFFGGNFFRGPRNITINEDGTLNAASKGRYLDKISELAITMPGTYGPGPVETSSELLYGGSGFLRTRSLGRYQRLLDPSDPANSQLRYDRLSEEMSIVPTRSSTFLNGAWETTSEEIANPSVGLTATQWPARPIAPDESDYIDTFRERSVASNGWEINITLKDGQIYAEISEINDILLHIRHKSSPRS